jgi:hypothetical protein
MAVFYFDPFFVEVLSQFCFNLRHWKFLEHSTNTAVTEIKILKLFISVSHVENVNVKCKIYMTLIIYIT